MDYGKIIRDVKDWPKEGIIFKDLTTVWKNSEAFKSSIDEMVSRYKNKGITKIVAAESRGFIYGSVLAYLLNAGFVPVRKPKKLPCKAICESYELEYGTDQLCMHEDALVKGDKVLLVDDLIATGGTCEAIIKLIRKLGAEVIEACFFVELTFLNGKISLIYLYLAS